MPTIVASLGDHPQVPRGVFDGEHFISGVDLVPTVLDYFGVEAPENLRGGSLRLLIEGRAADWPDYAFVESDYWARPDYGALQVRRGPRGVVQEWGAALRAGAQIDG